MIPLLDSRTRLAALAALLMAVPSGVLAAPGDTLSRTVAYPDTVVVEASRLRSRLADLATTATIVSPEQIRLGTAPGTHGVLAVVPGAHLIDLSGSETHGVVEARGFASPGQSSHMLVLIDEMPINDLETDRVDWNLLGQGQIDRVEFLRGASAFLWGNATMAGVVNIRTRKPGEGPSGWVQGAAGGFGRTELAGGANWSDEGFDLGVTGSGQSLDGWRDHSATDLGTGTVNLRVALSPSWDLRARVLGNGSEQEVPGPLPDPMWRDDPEQAGTPLDRRELFATQGVFELRGRTAAGFDLVAMVAGDRRDLEATETIIPGGTLDRTSESVNGRAELRAHWRTGSPWLSQLMIGADGQQGTLESRYHDPSAGGAEVGAGDVTRSTGALFALLIAEPAQRLGLTAGARVDWLRSSLEDPTGVTPPSGDDDLRAVSPTVGANLRLANGGNLYLSYARAFKAPALDQLYDQRPFDLDGPGGAPPIRISNNALQPQRGHHVDLGARTPVAGDVFADVAVYWAESTDEIGFDLVNFRHINIDESRHVGLEAGFGSAGAGTPWTWNASYALTRATFEGGDHDGNQINTGPEHQLYGRLSWRHRWSGALTAEVSHVASQWIDEDETHRLPDYTVADLGLTQALGPVELFGSVRNLFDERYATLGYVTVDPTTFGDLPLYFPAAGRTFRIGMRWGS
jgi:iron complex outermembrane receptor protein